MCVARARTLYLINPVFPPGADPSLLLPPPPGSSIEKEKLDTLKYVMLHSGINTAVLQNDEGLTALQLAASTDKHKALLLMLDLMRQQRCLKESIDVPEEETGRSALMLATAKGSLKCVDHLCVGRAGGAGAEPPTHHHRQQPSPPTPPYPPLRRAGSTMARRGC